MYIKFVPYISYGIYNKFENFAELIKLQLILFFVIYFTYNFLQNKR